MLSKIPLEYITYGGENLVFECSQCGECCSHLGLVFEIIEDRGDYSFLIRNAYTGTRQIVSVPPQLQPLFDDKRIFIEREEACPFFRENPDNGLYYCTVHLTRPEICREYGCWRLLILDREGNRAGRVMQARHLDSENPRLTEVWNRYILPIHELDDQEWDTRVADLLRTAGFIIKV